MKYGLGNMGGGWRKGRKDGGKEGWREGRMERGERKE